MLLRISCFLFFWLLGICCYADLPVLVIKAPENPQTGALIILDASESTADFLDWVVDTTDVQIPKDSSRTDAEQMVEQLRRLGFKVENPNAANDVMTHWIVNDGQILVIASYPGLWRLSLAGSNASGVKQLPWKIPVRGPITPIPPQDPPVTPDVPPIVPEFGLRASVADWKKDVPEASRSQSTAIIAALKDVSDRALAGQFTTVEDGETAVGDALQKLMATGAMSKTDWRSFGLKWVDAMTALKAIGRVKTSKDLGQALIEIMDGLK